MRIRLEVSLQKYTATDALYLGRGKAHAIALEGALRIKRN